MKRVWQHLETHKDKYMYAGVLLSAFAHTMNGVTVKMFVVGITSALTAFFS